MSVIEGIYHRISVNPQGPGSVKIGLAQARKQRVDLYLWSHFPHKISFLATTECRKRKKTFSDRSSKTFNEII